MSVYESAPAPQDGPLVDDYSTYDILSISSSDFELDENSDLEADTGGGGELQGPRDWLRLRASWSLGRRRKRKLPLRVVWKRRGLRVLILKATARFQRMLQLEDPLQDVNGILELDKNRDLEGYSRDAESNLQVGNDVVLDPYSGCDEIGTYKSRNVTDAAAVNACIRTPKLSIPVGEPTTQNRHRCYPDYRYYSTIWPNEVPVFLHTPTRELTTPYLTPVNSNTDNTPISPINTTETQVDETNSSQQG